MLGIAVPTMVAIVNRTTKPLNATFNGQPICIPAGYGELNGEIVPAGADGAPLSVMLPENAAEMVKRQNVLMGSEDPENPRDVEYLIGVEAWGDSIDHLEQSDAIERLDRSLMDDDAQGAVVSRNQHTRKLADKKRRRGRFTDERNYNPAGIRGDVGA